MPIIFNPLTAVSVYVHKTEKPSQKSHKKSTVSSKISKTIPKCTELIIIVYKFEVHTQMVTKVTMTSNFI